MVLWSREMETESMKPVFDGKFDVKVLFFQVYNVSILNKNGKEHIYDILAHLKNK